MISYRMIDKSFLFKYSIIFISIILLFIAPSDGKIFSEVTANTNQPIVEYEVQDLDLNHNDYFNLFYENLINTPFVDITDTTMYFMHNDYFNDLPIRVYYLDNILWEKLSQNYSTGIYYTAKDIQLSNESFLSVENRSIDVQFQKLNFLPESIISRIDRDLIIILPMELLPVNEILNYPKRDQYWVIKINIFPNNDLYDEISSTTELEKIQSEIVSTLSEEMMEDGIIYETYSFPVHHEIFRQKNRWNNSYEQVITNISPFIIFLQFIILYLIKNDIISKQEDLILKYYRGLSAYELFKTIWKSNSGTPLFWHSVIVLIYALSLSVTNLRIIMLIYLPWMVSQFFGSSYITYSFYSRTYTRIRADKVKKKKYNLKIAKILFRVSILIFVLFVFSLISFLIDNNRHYWNHIGYLPFFVNIGFYLISVLTFAIIFHLIQSKSDIFDNFSKYLIKRQFNIMKTILLIFLLINYFSAYNLTMNSIQIENEKVRANFSVQKTHTLTIYAFSFDINDLMQNIDNIYDLNDTKYLNIIYTLPITWVNNEDINYGFISIMDFDVYNNMINENFNFLEDDKLYVNEEIYSSFVSNPSLILSSVLYTEIEITPSQIMKGDIKLGKLNRDHYFYLSTNFLNGLNISVSSSDFQNSIHDITIDLFITKNVNILDLEETISNILQIPNRFFTIREVLEPTYNLQSLSIFLSIFYGFLIGFLAIIFFYNNSQLQITLKKISTKYNQKQLINKINWNFIKYFTGFSGVVYVLGMMAALSAGKVFLSNYKFNPKFNIANILLPVFLLITIQSLTLIYIYRINYLLKNN